MNKMNKITKWIVIILIIVILAILATFSLKGNINNTGTVAISELTATSTNIVVPPPFTFTKNLKFGMTDSDVLILQQYLNDNGSPVALIGFGSKGNETIYFRKRTKAALIKFQESNKSGILDSLGLKKGTGFFGPSSVAFINTNIIDEWKINNPTISSVSENVEGTKEPEIVPVNTTSSSNNPISNDITSQDVETVIAPVARRRRSATVPGAPTIGTATAGNSLATITFTAPFSNGGATIDYYTASSSIEGINVSTTSAISIVVTGLTNGTPYAFTIYAHNSVGTSTPSTISNSVTPQTPLTAIGAITGTTQVGSVLTAGVLTPAEATFTYQWQSATTSGGIYSDITGATASTYTLVAGDLGTYIKVIATANGNYSGTAISAVTAVILGNITFTYNGGSVTYGTVYNATTSKVWLDRNLGAIRVAQTFNDYLAYGDLFQWGRPADGHQLIDWTSATAGTGHNGTSSGPVASVAPGTNTFIMPSSNWSSIDNNTVIRSVYFGKTDGTGICPTGFRVPTDAELTAERTSWSSNNRTGAFASPLKLTVAGNRSYSSGSIFNVGSNGGYWSSSIGTRSLFFFSAGASMSSDSSASGLAVRCLKD